jgi:transposase-like protein/IS1 family transposase
MKKLRCPNVMCLLRTNPSLAMVIRFGFYQTRWGKRRRFRCKGCGSTFCRNSGSVYHRLQHRRATFDEVAALSVEGVNKSAIARVQQIAWNNVDRWLEKAATSCRRFNHQRITKIRISELQADEIRTIVGGKEQSPVWIFAAIEVGSRLWPSTVVGKRSYRNTLTLFRDLCARINGNNVPLIVTDGFEFYRQVVRRLFGAACLYGQVIKKRRNDRVVKVQRKPRFGAAWRWNEVWRDSEDSRQLITSYIERLNLTIRQGSAYLCPLEPLSRAPYEAAGRSSGAAATPLQLPQNSSCFEVWTRSQNPGDASGSDQKAADIPRHLHLHRKCFALGKG